MGIFDLVVDIFEVVVDGCSFFFFFEVVVGGPRWL